MRAKQLKAIGLQANEQGQVKADNTLLQQFVGLAEESGLCCSICREGYKFQPNKVNLINNTYFCFYLQMLFTKKRLYIFQLV